MEGIDLAGVVDSDFQGIQINFAPPRPAGFANFCGAGRGCSRLAFLRGGAGQPFFRGAGRGGAGRTSLVGKRHLQPSTLTILAALGFKSIQMLVFILPQRICIVNMRQWF